MDSPWMIPLHKRAKIGFHTAWHGLGEVEAHTDLGYPPHLSGTHDQIQSPGCVMEIEQHGRFDTETFASVTNELSTPRKITLMLHLTFQCFFVLRVTSIMSTSRCFIMSSMGLLGCHTSLAIFVVLEALLRCVVDCALAGDDLLDDGKDVAPVLEDGEGHLLARAVGDEICWK